MMGLLKRLRNTGRNGQVRRDEVVWPDGSVRIYVQELTSEVTGEGRETSFSVYQATPKNVRILGRSNLKSFDEVSVYINQLIGGYRRQFDDGTIRAEVLPDDIDIVRVERTREPSGVVMEGIVGGLI